MIYDGPVHSLAFSADSGRIYAGVGWPDEHILEFDTATGDVIRNLGWQSDIVNTAVLSSDGRYLLSGSSGSDDHSLRLNDLATRQAVRRYDGYFPYVSDVAFSPNSKQVLTGTWDDNAYVWDIETGDSIKAFVGHSDNITAAGFSPDGNEVFTGSADGTACLWNTETGDTTHLFDMAFDVQAVACSPDGLLIATGNDVGNVVIWNRGTGELVRDFDASSGSAGGLAFTPNSQSLLVGASWYGDDALSLWSVGSGLPIRSFPEQLTGVNSVACSPDGKWALASSYSDTVRMFNLATGSLVRNFLGHRRSVYAVAFSPNGQYALTGGADSTVRLWKTATGEQVRLFSKHRTEVHAVAFSPDGLYALSGSYEGTAMLWDVSDIAVTPLVDGTPALRHAEGPCLAVRGRTGLVLRIAQSLLAPMVIDVHPLSGRLSASVAVGSIAGYETGISLPHPLAAGIYLWRLRSTAGAVVGSGRISIP